MKKTLIRLTEADLYNVMRNIARRVITEAYSEDNGPETAKNDFYESGFESALKERYPDMDFDFEVEDNGTVTVIDLNTGNYYMGQGEIESRMVNLGYPSSSDYDMEAEGEEEYYDYIDCLREIMKKIDNNEPDGGEDMFEINVEDD